MIALAQTLHGYDQGHRLLASSGNLDAREHSLLERLSDLSGYLPSGTSFDRYHTGFPCGRYYAFACTWLDSTATRAGTVLTHTLLVPLQESRTLEDLWSLARHHRQPRGASDRAFYEQVLTLPALPKELAYPPLEPKEAVAAVALLFGQPERPLLWVDARRPESIVRHLWNLLWPEQRERFAFCTLALQLRAVEGRPFDVLGVPPEARGSFLERANSEAWWDSGKLLHPKVAGLPQQAWVQAIARDGAAEVHRLVCWCRENAQPLPEPKDIPILWRFLDLTAAASERLAAARSRADLCERLWPRLKSSHPVAEIVLQQLLARQFEGVIEPNPLWELTDFLQRRLVRERLATDSAFTSEVESVLARELTRRLIQVPQATARYLPELLRSSGSTHWKQPVLQSVHTAVANSPGPEEAVALATNLLRAAMAMKWPELVEAALSALPSLNRRLTLQEAAGPDPLSPDAKVLLEEAAHVAERFEDELLLFAVWKLRGEPLRGLTAAIHILARKRALHETQLESLLSEVDESIRLAWALEVSDPWLAPIAATCGANVAKEQRLSIEELAQRCSGKPNGARLFIAFANALARPELERVLRPTPVLARDIIALALRDERATHAETIARVAQEALPPEHLLGQELLDALKQLNERWRARDFLSHLGPQWVRAVCIGTQPPALLVAWLVIPGLREWLRYTPREWLFSACGRENRGRCLPNAASVTLAWLASNTAPDAGWISSLLEPLLAEASPADLDTATGALVSILRHPSSARDSPHLAGEILGAVTRTLPPSGFRLVELTFSRVYARAERDAPSWVHRLTSWWRDVKSWDRTKALRFWLLDTYLRCGWPPESLLRCLNGDTALFYRLVHRAARSPQGMALLRNLPAALHQSPELLSYWGPYVEQALANPYRPVDYE